ncbi:hypothetical protein N9W11_04680 [Psychrosphaera haliotis]|nr:hypothetical protein [Psychrosphaera haliotis]
MKSVFGFMMLATLLISCSGESKEEAAHSSGGVTSTENTETDAQTSVANEGELFMSFDFIDGKVENGFDEWFYSDKGDNECNVYNGLSQSNLCRIDGLKLAPYYNYYNTSHMGWTRFGFIDAGTSIAKKGSSLKIQMTGGAYANSEGGVSFMGPEVKSKQDFINADLTLPSSGEPSTLDGGLSLYLKSQSSTALFDQFKGKNRLTVWLKMPNAVGNLASQVKSNSRRRPNIQFSIYPFINDSRKGHYYHYVSNIPMGGWTKVQFDAHPLHFNGGSPGPYSAFDEGGYEFSGNGQEYFEHIAALAIVPSFSKSLPVFSEYYIDEIRLGYVDYENEETINNVGVGFDPESLLFDISFNDKYRCLKCSADYQIRYSFSPINNINFEDAYIPKEVINFNRALNNSTGIIKKPNSGYNQIWAALEIKDEHKVMVEQGETIYFAIKDVSEREGIEESIIDNELVSVPGLGDVKKKNLVKTISYEFSFIDDTVNDSPLSIVTEELPVAKVNTKYSAQLLVSGGVPPYNFDLTDRPNSTYKINESGFLKGITEESESFELIARIKDSVGSEIEKSFTVKVEKEVNPINGKKVILLADFKHSSEETVLSFYDLNTVIRDKYTGFNDLGIYTKFGVGAGYNYQGIQGRGLDLTAGDKLVFTWRNASSADYQFTPAISFTDNDRQASGKHGVWHQMEPLTLVESEQQTSTYTLSEQESGLIKIINVAKNSIENSAIILDKIELETIESSLNLQNVELVEGVEGRQYQFDLGEFNIDTNISNIEIAFLPPGLELNDNHVIEGTPVSAGNYEFELKVHRNDKIIVNVPAKIKIYPSDYYTATNCKVIANFRDWETTGVYIDSDFKSIIKDKYTGLYLNGFTNTLTSSGAYNYQGVSEGKYKLSNGDKIRLVWYNNSDERMYFNPRISLTSVERYSHETATQWQEFDSVTIAPSSYGLAEYIYTGDTNKYQSININVNYDQKAQLILNEIQLVQSSLSNNAVCMLD